MTAPTITRRDLKPTFAEDKRPLADEIPSKRATHAAANDDVARVIPDGETNPLWVVSIGLAVLFAVAAIAMSMR